MGRRSRRRSWAQRPRRFAAAIVLIAAGCSNSRDPAGALRRPAEWSERPTGCIDTPFIGPDQHGSTGIQCGRETSLHAGLLRGRVVLDAGAGLPGAGLEAVWVSVHDSGSSLGRLPPPRAETKTGPQGVFALELGLVGEWLIAVRGSPGGAVLAARRIVIRAGERPPELILLVPAPAGEQPALDADGPPSQDTNPSTSPGSVPD